MNKKVQDVEKPSRFVKLPSSANFVVFAPPSASANTTSDIFDPDRYPLYNHVVDDAHEYHHKGEISSQIHRKLLQADECPNIVGLSDITRYLSMI